MHHTTKRLKTGTKSTPNVLNPSLSRNAGLKCGLPPNTLCKCPNCGRSCVFAKHKISIKIVPIKDLSKNSTSVSDTSLEETRPREVIAEPLLDIPESAIRHYSIVNPELKD